MKRYTALVPVLAAIVACNEPGASPDRILGASTATATPQYSQELLLPVGATTTTEVTGCDNSPGQPSQGGVGGNPWLWFNFLSGSGDRLGDPALLGRCEQLSNA